MKLHYLEGEESLIVHLIGVLTESLVYSFYTNSIQKREHA